MANDEKVFIQLSIPLRLIGIWKYYHQLDFKEWIIVKIKDDIRIMRSLAAKEEDSDDKRDNNA